MQIHSLLFTNNYTYRKQQQNTSQMSNPISRPVNDNTLLKSKFNDYLLSFGARVDKGLERFYDKNKDIMPVTVKSYVENLDDKSGYTPLQAQINAFGNLKTIQSVEDIKSAYKDEPLFFDLKNPTQTKATRGILNSVNETDELLSLMSQGVLKDKSNLTVYLVKKVFLEAKTIDEINKDLEKDLDKDFKDYFKAKNKDSKYVYGSTLKALGIHTPAFEYQQSLRYTKDGYSDLVGDKISQGQRAFWDSLDDTERTARAKKSVEKFENWWNSYSHNEKLDMIATQMTMLELLKSFKKQQRAENKKDVGSVDEISTPQTERKHTKVGSQKLSQDELFVKWASNNLKIFEEAMSEADKDTLHVKRMQRLTARWAQMSAEERTDYISKMKSGSEPLRYTMIDAWNHSTDLIKDLSLHLKENQIYKPADLLYSTQEFSQFQSKVMNEFWAKNPQYCESLGKNIAKSQEKIQDAMNRGTFEELKKQIMRDKNARIKEIEKFKMQTITGMADDGTFVDSEYKKDFVAAYRSHVFGKTKSIPECYYNDLFEEVLSVLSKEAVIAWTKNLKGEDLSAQETDMIKKFVAVETPAVAKTNRALEAAVADTLFECTKDPVVYTMSNSDVKMALYHLERNESPIILDSHKTGKRFVLHILKRKFDAKRINLLYNKYKEQLPNDETDDVINNFFTLKEDAVVKLNTEGKDKNQIFEIINQQQEELKKYLETYGKSLNILFSEKSAYPLSVKKAFYEKFCNNMPVSLKDSAFSCVFAKDNAFNREEKFKELKLAFARKYDFVPMSYIDVYMSEMIKQFRENTAQIDAETFERLCCKKRKSAIEHGKLAIFPKNQMNAEKKLKSLALEQALAEALYEATGNNDVFAMQFEELCDNIEVFNLVKKYPSEARTYYSSTAQRNVTISAKRRVNTNRINNLYKIYTEEIKDWVNNDVKQDGKAYFEDLLGILNPDETNKEKDLAVSSRIKAYKLNLVAD